MKMRSFFLVALTVLLGVCLGSFAWAADEPLPGTPCVDVEKICVDAGSPEDPISFEVTLTNCSDVMFFYCDVKDVLIDEVLIEGQLLPGETIGVSSHYYPSECGDSTNRVVVWCAYLRADGTSAWVFDEAEATCSVPCDGSGGCTLTPGYWKTHSIYGPAPYDATWAMIGEDTPFFLSGISYYEALWTAPKRGNAYFILAHAYIAAQLNVLNGASTPSDVALALSGATDLFNAYTPEFIGGLRGNHDLRKEFVGMAEILDDYNNGIIGPGHCGD